MATSCSRSVARLSTAVAALVLLLAAAPGPRATAFAQSPQLACETEPDVGADGVRFVRCQVLVRFRVGTPRVEIDTVIAAQGTSILVDFETIATGDGSVPLGPGDEDIAGVFLVQILADRTVTDTIAGFVAEPSVDSATPNHVGALSAHQPTPNDLLPGQYGLLNVGQPVPPTGGGAAVGGRIDADIDAPQGWALHVANRGTVDCSDVVIGVVDSGIDLDNDGDGLPDTGADPLPGDFADPLGSNYWVNPAPLPAWNDVFGVNLTRVDAVPRAIDGDVQDILGHGTWVSSVIAARGNNALGLTGICWRARLMALRVSVAGELTEDRIIAAVAYAIFQKRRGQNVRVLNMSFTFYGALPNLARAIRAAAANDILVTAAAGNEGLDVDGALPFPFAAPPLPCATNTELAAIGLPPVANLICAAGSNSRDERWVDSNYGAHSVDLAAPAQDIQVLALGAPGGVRTTVVNGTSFAAPAVAGMAALCWTAAGRPALAALTAAQMRSLILRFADRKEGVDLVGAVPMSTTQARLRWACSADLGDLREQATADDACGYHTRNQEPHMRFFQPPTTCRGPVHLDTGLEWLGRDVSNEYNADTPPPLDEDPVGNIVPLPDSDRADDGLVDFVLGPAGVATGITVRICGDVFGLTDVDGGRYGPGAGRLLYLNGYFDWNRDGDFDLPAEHNVSWPVDASAVFPAGTFPNVVPPTTRCFQVVAPFIPPAPRAGLPAAWRLRLDYGENVSGLLPARYWRSDVFPATQHRDIALFGEVEDYAFGDHYLCRDARDRERHDCGVVNLTDQFFHATYRTRPVELFCTPADKNREGVIDPSTHLKAYRITRVAGDHTQPVIDLTTQFGTVRLHGIKESHLMVPTAKALNSVPDPPDPARPGYEHYRCYKASLETPAFPRNLVVEVEDQFGAGKYLVRKPRRFCAPATKQRPGMAPEPIRNALRHLVCYGVRVLDPIVAPDEVQANNQCGPERVQLRREKELCVPALKNPVF